MENQCSERRFIYLFLCQFFIQQRRNGNIDKCAICNHPKTKPA